MIAIENAIQKIRKEAEEIGSPIAKRLGIQVIENIKSATDAERVLAEDKSLADCKKSLDAFAAKNRQGNESVVTHDDAQRLIFEYFGFEKGVINDSTFSGITIAGKSSVVNVLDLI